MCTLLQSTYKLRGKRYNPKKVEHAVSKLFGPSDIDSARNELDVDEFIAAAKRTKTLFKDPWWEMVKHCRVCGDLLRISTF